MAVLGALGDLVLALSADTARFQSDLGRGNRMAQKFGQDVSRALGRIATTLLALGGAAGFGALIKGQINAADAAGKMAQKIGMSTEALSAYMVSAQLSGVETAQLQVGMQQLSKNQADFVAGMGEAKAAFAALGITQAQVNALNGDTAAIFELVAGKLAGFEDGANKTAIAMKIFGRSGAELIPMINSLEKTRQEAEMLGAVIDKKTAAAAERFNDNLTRVGISVKAVGLSVARELLPMMEELSQAMVKAGKSTGEMSAFAKSAKTILETLVIVGANVKFVFETIGLEITRVTAAAAKLATGDIEGAKLVWNAIGEGIKKSREELDAFERRILSGAAPAVRGFQADVRALDNALVKGAAPALRDTAAEAKAVEERFKAMSRAINAAHDDALAWAEAGIEAQKAIEKAFAETLDRDDMDLISEAPLLEDAAEQIFDIEKATDAAAKKAESFNFTFDSALENVIVKGGKARDVVDALIADLSRMVTRQLVTEPLGQFVKGALGNAGGISGILNSIFPSSPSFGLSSAFEGMQAFAEGTDFVPRTGLAMVHKGEKITSAEQNARGGGNVYMTVVTPDAGSFRSARGQIEGDMVAAMSRARRNS